MAKIKYSPELGQSIANACEKNGLNFGKACDLLKVCSKTARKWEHSQPDFAEALQEARARFWDRKRAEWVESNDPRLIALVLKTESLLSHGIAPEGENDVDLDQSIKIINERITAIQEAKNAPKRRPKRKG